MKATVNVLCYRSKTLSNGEHPLMICVCKDGKRKYVSLGISVNPKFWDFEKNKPKRDCPNREQLIKVINEQEQKYAEQILEFSVEKREYTPTTLIEAIVPVQKARTVGELFNEYIAQLKDEGRLGYALSVQQVCNSLLKYKGHLDIYFSEIDVNWLKAYESWLRCCKLADNTIGIRFRTLRAVYNLALAEGLVKADCYPFKKYKVSKLHKETAKRAITKEQVKQVIDYDVSGARFYKKLAVDMFAFSYLMGGINFTDMAFLTDKNVEGGRLVYVRQKTKKLIMLPLQEKAVEIMNRYRSPQRKFIFPILDERERTLRQIRNRIYDVLDNVNGYLKEIGKELGVELKISSYVARHSYATVLKRSGVSTSVISESLGHSSERVTQIYLDSFENKQLNDAMKNLL
ncbi:site-specific integrase [Bacteroides nordii]|jgi:site-specific recombinase XerD|uniref:site-specific integrase n=1 Tax=Bacteroides nordii TaxID=291645 RepID=UPI00189D08C2|nr:site-specific integrase [Bacteroides nordii]MCE8466653.1 site-specific integrase [Bacteroides nordii]UYU48280.1 site-specific integrase [Bacteroides nordii]